MQMFQYSDTGLELTKNFEGLRLQAYQDCAGVWTVGYGHTGHDVIAGLHVSNTEAENLLRADLRDAVACVNHYVLAPIEQHHFDALVDFCYNTGRGNFSRSTLLATLNLGDFTGAADAFSQWITADGKVVAGLVRRRAAESALFRGEHPTAV